MSRETGSPIPDQENPELKEARERFEVELEMAADGARDCDARLYFVSFESYEGLEDRPDIIIEILKEKYGFDPDNANEATTRQYHINTDDGDIKVSIFRTNDPEVFIGKYEHPDGDIDWSLQPENYQK